MKTGLWLNIESGSELSLSVSGKTHNDTQFVGGARFVPDVGEDEMWKVIPGPNISILPSGIGSSVRIGLRFTGASEQTAVVNAVVTKPNGSPHPEMRGSTTFTCELKGKKGSGIERSTLILMPLFE